ncbi:RHS repeat-associated core domain-containing protein [Paludibaculum fermentans]|uniref:RHS repeat-associated core domain-containing protein n=1 Tax=Paludibaculum fermentans TaxID=1473598 RepID=UPI003EB7A823
MFHLTRESRKVERVWSRTIDGDGRRVMKEPWQYGTQSSSLKTDTTTQGTWRGVYGAHGHNLAGSGVNTPAYATVTMAGQTLTTWSASTSDIRALEVPTGGGRIAAAWTSTSSITIDIQITDKRLHQLALYVVDWANSGSLQTVAISNYESGAVLGTKSLSQFGGGLYTVWSVGGHVKVTLTAQGGTTAMLSGIFWDAIPGNETYVYDATGRLAAEYGSVATTPGVSYLATDHLGSTRHVLNGGVAKRYDYWPFGEEMLAGTGGRQATEYNSSVPTVGQPDQATGMKFTGKEPDSETGLDYFGARYFSGAQGRFTTPDPLMASARASNSQTWNRYAYALNNPLRYVDPDGMDVPQSCADDEKCKIKVKVNIIYDTRANKGKGLTPAQKEKAQKEQKRIEATLRKANVQVERTETPGAVTASGAISGSQDDALNIFVSDQKLPSGVAGVSGTVAGVATTQFDINAISTDTWLTSVPPFSFTSWTPTWVHEYGEQLLHVGQESSFLSNFLGDAHVDRLMQGLVVSAPGYAGAARSTLENKRYAVPLTPEANKPRQ